MRQLIVITSLLLMTGCATSPFAGLARTPQAPQKMANWTQEETVRPRIVGKVDGNPFIAYETEKKYTASSNEVTPGKTIGQKIGSFFSSLTIFGILFVVICLLTVGGAPLVWIWSKFLKARSALKKTIVGIEELNQADQDKVKDELSKTQDSVDKRYITDLKAEIKKDEVVK